jgi:hypothetical protein
MVVNVFKVLGAFQNWYYDLDNCLDRQIVKRYMGPIQLRLLARDLADSCFYSGNDLGNWLDRA